MVNERMMILEMIKDGKISVDDGVKLLNAINKNNSSSFGDFKNDLKYKITKPDSTKIKQNTQAFFNKTEEIFDDFTKSVKDFFNTNNSNQNNTTTNVEQVEPINDNNNDKNDNIN